MKYLIFSLIVLTGCVYKMPSDRYIATRPNAGNPMNTKAKSEGFIPSK